MSLRKLNRTEFETAVSGGWTVVDFTAPWCSYCRRLGPTLDALEAELAGKVALAALDVDEEEAISDRFGVETIPALILFREGAQVGQTLVNPGSKTQITDWLRDNGAL